MIKLFCPVNLFDKQVNLMLLETIDDASAAIKDTFAVPVRELEDALIKYCLQEKVDELHLFGSTDYLNGLKENINLGIEVYVNE